MTFPEPSLTVLEAIDRARADGLATELLAGLARQAHELLVSLDTIDPDPTLSLRQDHAKSETLLSERGQSGPERWEYPLSFSEYRDRFFLRIGGEEGSVDVPVLPAVFGIVERYGLVEDPVLSAPARVDRTEFERAMGLLKQSHHRERQRSTKNHDENVRRPDIPMA